MEGQIDKDSGKVRAEIQKKIALLRKDLDDKEKSLKHTQKKARRKSHILQKLREHAAIDLSPVESLRPSVVSFKIENNESTTQDSCYTSSTVASGIAIPQDSIQRRVSRRTNKQHANTYRNRHTSHSHTDESSEDLIHSSFKEHQKKKIKKRRKVTVPDIDWSFFEDDVNDMYSGIKRRRGSCRESQESTSSHSQASSVLISAKDFNARKKAVNEIPVKNCSQTSKSNVENIALMNENSPPPSPLTAEVSPAQPASKCVSIECKEREDFIPPFSHKASLSSLSDKRHQFTTSNIHDESSQSPSSSQFPLTPDLFEADDSEEEINANSCRSTNSDSDKTSTNSSDTSGRLNLCIEELKNQVSSLPVVDFSLSEEYSQLMAAKTTHDPCLESIENRTETKQKSLLEVENSDDIIPELACIKRTPFLMPEKVDITYSFKSSKKAWLCLPSARLKANAVKHLIQCGDAIIAACDYRLHSYDSHTGELKRGICIDHIIPPDTDQYDVEDLAVTRLNNEATLIVIASNSNDRVCCFLNSEFDATWPLIRRSRVFGDCLTSVIAVTSFLFLAVVDLCLCSSLLLSYDIRDSIEKTATFDEEIASLTLIQSQQNVLLVVTKHTIGLWSVKCSQLLKSIKFEFSGSNVSRHAFDCKGVLLLPVLDDSSCRVLALNPVNGSITEVCRLQTPQVKLRWKTCLMIGHLICAQTHQHQLFIWSAISGRCLGCSKVKVHQISTSSDSKSFLLNTSNGFRFFNFSV